MLRYRTAKERAKIAVAMSVMLVVAAFALGPKGAFPLLILGLGHVAELAVTGDIEASGVGAIFRFLMATVNWFVPVFVILTFTNPKPRRSSDEQAPNKAPEPTPTAVTSPAAQEPRQP